MTEESSADVIIQIAKPVLEQKKLYLITKRAFDIVCSFLGLLILAIPMIIIASKIIIAKSLYARGYETNSVIKKLFMQVCRMFPLKGLKAICIRKKDQKSQLVHTFFGAGSKYEKNIFPRAWIEQSVEMQFEDGVFPVSAYYDELLTKLYGDYHALPNPEDRKCKEHVAILDLEHPYEAHLSELHNMQFDVLTRSIR